MQENSRPQKLVSVATALVFPTHKIYFGSLLLVKKK